MKLLSVKNLAHVFGVVWLLAVLTFIGIIVLGLNGGNALTERDNTVLVYAFTTGIFAFLGASVLYMVHYLSLRKKALLGTPGSVRRGVSPAFLILLVLFLGFVGVVAVKGAYNLGQADKFMEAANTPESVSNDEVLLPPITHTVRDVKTAQPTTPPVVQEEKTQQSNLVSCYVYGQTFNLTPEKCRYYQSEEAGADKALNSDYYTSPTQYESTQTSTPIPTSAPEKYHSTQEACRQNCYATYKNYPDTSLFKQQCVNSCSSKYPN